MSRRGLVRALLAAVVAVNLALGCWWMLGAGDADPGRPARWSAEDGAFDRQTMPELPPRHPPPREEPAGAAARSGAARPAASGPSHLVLKVCDAGKAPLSGVTVVATESTGATRSTATAADGSARFENVTEDAVELVLSRGDLATQRLRPVAMEPGVRTIAIAMTEGRAVDGIVLEKDGTPVGGAVVSVGDSPAWPATATTSYDGRFRIAGVPVSATTLDVAARLHVAAKAAIAGEARSVEVRLEPACRLEGAVCDAGGAPIADALVTAVPDGDADRWRAQRGWTGADGRYAIDGMPIGLSWDVEATKPGFAAGTSSSPVKLDAECRSSWCNLALRPAARVTVRVVDDEGAPLPEVVVEARLASTGWVTRRSTDEDGVIAFNVPGAGACRFTAHAARGARWTADVDVAEGDSRSLEMRRPAPGPVAGVVVDDRGEPVAGAEVRIGEDSATSGSDGAFRIESIESGQRTIEASAAGHTPVVVGDVVAPSESARVVLPRCGRVSFRLRTPSGSAAHFVASLAPDRRALRRRLAAESRQEGTTDGGTIRLVADAGDQTLTVEAAGFVNVKIAAAIRPGEDTDLGVLELKAAVTVEVRVTDQAGRPIVGATVVARHKMFESQPRTDAQGVSRIAGVDPDMGDLEIAVVAAEYETVTVTCATAESPVVVALRALAHLWVKVKRADGVVAEDVEMRFEELNRPASAQRTKTRVTTSSGGQGRMEARLPAARWRIRVVCGETTLAERDVDVKPGDNPPLEITLEK